jgi:hypothetical protein
MVRAACLAALVVGASASDGPSPIRKVVTLIEEMKAQVEKEAKDDMAAYDEYKCWCDTNGAEKQDAIEYASERIGDLESFLEEAKGKEGELKTQIEQLEADIDEDNSAIGTAKSVRAKENEEFAAYEADSKESIGLMGEAITILDKVQFVQKDAPAVQAALVQVRKTVERHGPRYQNVMQKDLYDMLSSFEGLVNSQGKFLPKAALEQQGAPGGAAAGAKSHNSASGGIVGMLGAMNDEFVRDLSAAQKAEFKSLVDFQNLQAAKLAEIAAANEQKDMKDESLADLLNRAAKAAEDLETMKNAKTADEKFVAEMTENCQVVDQEFEERSKVRQDEIVALSDVLGIVTSDEARDLFAKSVGTSFLQEDASIQSSRTDKALRHLATTAKKTGNWALLAFVSHARLDAFTKVKEALDKLMAELKVQQQDEVEKKDLCDKEIDQTEDDIKVAQNNKEDLEEKNKDLSNTLETLGEEIKTLKQEVADMEVQLKKAGIDRKAENEMFQQQTADQRATVKVLNMAMDRLKEFYTPGAFMQVKAHQPEPGAAVEAPPAKPQGYEKSAGAGGVMQLIAKIISEAEQAEKELEIDENHSQKRYAEFVTATTASLEADRQSIAEKEKQTAETSSELSATKESQLANQASLEKLDGLLMGLHADCDYIIKYFDIRQQARQEEMDSIDEAYAILSGAGR